jgi:cobalamin biosynthesis protein CobT
MAGNADGENVLWEYGKLRARSEPKKILVVLSDGLPDDSKHMYDCEKYTKEVCDTIQKRGDVLLIGIGIMDNAVERFYRRNRVINSAHEIEEVMLKILSEEVLHD